MTALVFLTTSALGHAFEIGLAIGAVFVGVAVMVILGLKLCGFLMSL